MAETRTARNRTAWFGWVTFAAVLLAVIGILNILEGLVALLQNQVAFIDGDSLVVVDLTGLGIVMLVSGGLLLAAGIGLLARNTVARVAAIAIVALHALTQVGTLGAYPVWSLLMITLDVLILFAITVHWTEVPGQVEAPPGGIHRMDRDMQQRGAGFPVNSPTSPSRGEPAHAAPDLPAPHQQAPSYQQPPSPYEQQPSQQQPPNAGPYPPERPSSPAHTAPTSGYGTGAT